LSTCRLQHALLKVWHQQERVGRQLVLDGEVVKKKKKKKDYFLGGSNTRPLARIAFLASLQKSKIKNLECDTLDHSVKEACGSKSEIFGI